MSDFALGLAMVLVIEGLIYAAFPDAMKRMLEQVRELPAQTLRTSGLVALALGVGLVWVLRH